MSSVRAQQKLPSNRSLSAAARKAYIRSIYQSQSRFQHDFGVDLLEFDCGTHSGMLRDEILRLLAVRNISVPEGRLEQLHRHIGPELKKYGLDDGITRISSLIYDTDDTFTQCYHRFIRDALRPNFPVPFYFEAMPAIHIACPDGENNAHHPRYRTDAGASHPPEGINIRVPLTAPQPPQHHGFRCADIAHSRDLLARFDFDVELFSEAVKSTPFNLRLHDISPQLTTPLGRYAAFDSRAIYANEPMQVHTSIAIGIRIIPVEDFNNLTMEYQDLAGQRPRYVPGQAYHALSSAEL